MGIYWILLVVFHATVLVHTGNSCTIQITSDKDFVLMGDSAQVNCTSTDCKELFFETRLRKSTKINIDYFTMAEVNVTEWDDSPVKCLAEAEGKEFKKEFRVIPYALPSKVEIQMKTVLKEDKEHEVTCQMYGVAPLSHVTLSLTKSGNILYNETFESDTSKGPQNRSHTFKFTASRSDDHQDFSCQVTLNLTRVTNTTVQSSPITAFTYTMPEIPHIIAGKWIEYGTMNNISCAVYNTFPSQSVTTELSVDGSPTLKALGDTMIVLGLDTTDLTLGEHQLTCVSQVYGFSKQSSMDIIIYELPVTNLTLSSEVVTVGKTLTVNCSIIQGNVEYFGLSVRVDDKEEKRVNAPNLEMNINIVNRKPNIPVICQTFIRESDQEVIQESSKILTVHYKPDFTNVSCPPSLVWLEKSETRFQCSSEGNPKPEEQCSLNALSLEPSTSFTAERNMSGEYTCHASNSLGNVTVSVAVAVQYAPGPTRVEISSSSIRAGGSVNLTCHSDALPPPVYSWSMPPSAQVVFSTDNSSITITDASSYHNGTYTCHARNQHGKSSEKLSLEVQSDNSVLYGVLIGVALLICLGAALGIAYYCLRQNGKKGFYDLVRRKAGNHKDANIPLQENSDNGP